jgi:hypothetical protein
VGAGGAPAAAQGQDGGRGGAGRLGRGGARPLQLHPRRRHAHARRPQEGTLRYVHGLAFAELCAHVRQAAPERWRLIKAHGTAVGLPTDDDMGNSEVGHNALGAGQIYAQG